MVAMLVVPAAAAYLLTEKLGVNGIAVLSVGRIVSRVRLLHGGSAGCIHRRDDGGFRRNTLAAAFFFQLIRRKLAQSKVTENESLVME